LYDWYTAKGACPEGWRLPSRQDWGDFVEMTGGDVAGRMLKSKNGWRNNGNGTDAYGFWWTDTEIKSSYAYYRQMSSENGEVAELNNAGDGLSVRCVADK